MDILQALSLKGYRFLTCRHLSMLYFSSEDTCLTRMAELHRAGLVMQLFVPTMDGEKREAIYTLTLSGARQLARLKEISHTGLAMSSRPSYLFLDHGLRISDFMCSLEAALKGSNARLVSWMSERQLKPPRGKPVRVPNPLSPGEKIPVIPDGLFSLQVGDRVEQWAIEVDCGTMSRNVMRKKMLGYIQLYRKGLHRSWWGIPHFRVLLVTTTPHRRDNLRAIYREIKYCPNMWWFSTWQDISLQKVLSGIWLKCRDQERYSLLRRGPDSITGQQQEKLPHSVRTRNNRHWKPPNRYHGK